MSLSAGSEAMRLFIAKVDTRSSLNADERTALLGLRVTPRHVHAHREIGRFGEHVEHACLVAEGHVARFAQLENGSRQIVSIHIAGDVVDLHSLMLPSVPTPLLALTSASLLQVAHADLRGLAVRHAGIAAAFWRECVVDGNIVAEWLVNVGRRDARARLAHLLCEFAVRSGQIGTLVRGRCFFPITQEQIADALGLTPVHVNRMMQTLRSERLVQLSQRELTILDWEGLRRVGEFDQSYLHLPTLSVEDAQIS
ncbi:Crp/Fnr family transcriptional regulator [Sphingomonas aracearum]|nr:Crp/Fnr family transcriptional regulator [Sphingomonas aracearum]